jgi:hypothetical protein
MGSRSLSRSDEGGLKSISVRGKRTKSAIFRPDNPKQMKKQKATRALHRMAFARLVP